MARPSGRGISDSIDLEFHRSKADLLAWFKNWMKKGWAENRKITSRNADRPVAHSRHSEIEVDFQDFALTGS
jgi:hypothetical protein